MSHAFLSKDLESYGLLLNLSKIYHRGEILSVELIHNSLS